MPKPSQQKNPVDLYFMDARSKLLDIAAFMDRVERESAQDDFRYQAFQAALQDLDEPNRAEAILKRLSDPSREPIAAATTKAACGAPPPPNA